MASEAAKGRVALTLGGLYPNANLGGIVADEWSLALDALTDAQIAASLDYLRKRYGQGMREDPRFAPTPSQFIAWSRSSGTSLGGIDAARVWYDEQETERLQPTIRFVISRPERPSPRYVSTQERVRRARQLADMQDGLIPLALLRHEAFAVLAANDPLDPTVLAIRNRQRAALGWPVLNDNGREITTREGTT